MVFSNRCLPAPRVPTERHRLQITYHGRRDREWPFSAARVQIRTPIRFPFPRGFPTWPPSSRGILSPSPLALSHESAYIRRWPNLENAAVFQGRMLRNELYSMIHVPRLKDENAAELFLGFRIGTVHRRDF